MFDYIDNIITAFIGLVFGVAIYICTRKLDEWKHKRNYSKLGVVIMDSLLEEVRTGLDIIKNNQCGPPPKNSWDGMKTIPDEVMLIIFDFPEKIKQKSKFNCKDIRSHCKNYFEHITEDWNKNIQYYQGETEEVKKMLEQTKSLLEKNF